MTRSSEQLAESLRIAAEIGMEQRTLADGRVIVTAYWRPPIPINNFDWSAHLDDYDGAPDAGFQPVGHGATEAEAIADLLEQIDGEAS